MSEDAMSEEATTEDGATEDATTEDTEASKQTAKRAAARRGRQKNVRKWIRRSLWAIAALGLLAMIVVAFLPKPIPVDATEVERGSLRVTVDEDGRTRVTDRYVVSSPLSGNLARVELRPGDRVEAGQVIARVVPSARPLMDAQSRAEAEARVAAQSAQRRQTRSAVERAEAALAYSEREVERQRRLVGSGGVAQSVLDAAELDLRARREELTSARFGVRVATHQLELAEAALGRYDGDGEPEQLEVTSPIEGAVLRVMQQSGGAVAAGTPILELGDPTHLEIAVDVLTSDAVHIEPGDHVEIERWGGEQALEAHVRLVEPSAFTRTSALGVEEQRVNVVIDLDSQHEVWSRLGDGFRVEARIVIWEEEGVLRVPSSTVFRHEGGWAVYRIDGDLVEMVEVEVGRRNGLAAQILGGLEEGERVVAHPSDRVTDGVQVAAR